MSYFKDLKSKYQHATHSDVADPAEHVILVFTEFDLFRRAVTKREIKSRNEIMAAMKTCVDLLSPRLLQLPANVENDIKQFALRLTTMVTMIGRKDGVYKFADLAEDLNDASRGKLQFIEQRIKNNVKMFREGTGLPPINDVDRAKMQKFYSNSNKLPERLATPFAVVHYPLVPLFEDFNLMTDKALKTVGLRYERMAESFVVLKDQVLLAADIPKLTEMFADTKKRQKSGIDLPAVVMDILEQINKNNPGNKFELMSPIPVRNPRNANIALFWLIPADKLRALGRVGRTSRLQSWSLPHRHVAEL